MDQGRREVDVKNGQEEDHVDRQANQEKCDHPHFGLSSTCDVSANGKEQISSVKERRQRKYSKCGV